MRNLIIIVLAFAVSALAGEKKQITIKVIKSELRTVEHSQIVASRSGSSSATCDNCGRDYEPAHTVATSETRSWVEAILPDGTRVGLWGGITGVPTTGEYQAERKGSTIWIYYSGKKKAKFQIAKTYPKEKQEQ